MNSTSSIGAPLPGAADLAGVRQEAPFDQSQEASFNALVGANAQVSPAAGSRSPVLPLDLSALSAADEKWVNFVWFSQQLQNPGLTPDQQDTLLAGLQENLRTFQQQNEPIVRQVGDFFAAKETVDSG